MHTYVRQESGLYPAPMSSKYDTVQLLYVAYKVILNSMTLLRGAEVRTQDL